MADIDVQRKSGTPLWAWLLALLALALLAWLLIGWLADDDEAEVVEADPVVAPVVIPVDTAMGAGAAGAAATGTVPAVVESYLTTCTAAGGEPAEMGREHQFSVTCFRDLRAAIDSVMVRGQVSGVDVTSRVNDFQAAVQRLEQSQASSTEHAGLARDAANAASALLSGMLTTGYGGQQDVTIAVGEAEQAANAIQPGTQMLEQREAVRTFFREAGEALRLMAERSATAAAPA